MSHVTGQISQCDVTQIKLHDNCGKVVHRPCSNCISSVQEIHKNFIEFSLSSTDKEAVGFILAQELAILTGQSSQIWHMLFARTNPTTLSSTTHWNSSQLLDWG